MNDFDCVIRGGTVVTASDTFKADIGITEGRIAALGTRLGRGAREIDATDRLVMPGGIDSHVHVAQPSGGSAVCADTFASATLSAAFGGNTCIMPFALQEEGKTLRRTVSDYHALARGQCAVDYAFHLIVSRADGQTVGQDLPALIRDGYKSLKVYMTYDNLKLSDYDILKVMAVARRENAFVMVHAENDGVIRYLTEVLELAGQTAPIGHALSRPLLAEREAVGRAIALSEVAGVPIMIVHVSGRETMEEIRRAQSRGHPIFAETCPQYLVLTSDDLNDLNMDGEKFICSPPPRDLDAQLACWEGLQQQVFAVFSSDHAPFRFGGGDGKRPDGRRTSFRWVPNGIPGIETRLPILFSQGVGRRRIDVNRFVALTATNHARLYGLKHKGTIAPGYDADIAIWHPEMEETITQAILHHGADYTPYEGLKVKGWPVTVLLRGETVIRDRRLAGPADRGRPCDRA